MSARSMLASLSGGAALAAKKPEKTRMAATSPATDENRVPVARRNRAPSLGGVAKPGGFDRREADPVRAAVRFYAETPGVPDVTSVDHVRVARRGQVLQAGVGVTQKGALVAKSVNFVCLEGGQPLFERAFQQRPFPGSTHELGENRDHQRGDRSAALVVTALQDVAPLPPGNIAEPVELEAVTRSRGLRSRGRASTTKPSRSGLFIWVQARW